MLKYRNKYSAEDVKKRWAELSDFTKPVLHESVNKASRSTLINKVAAGDGNTYGIVQESTKYFVKVSKNNVDDSTNKDFDYIGGKANALHERFDSYPAAIRRLNIKVASLRESYKMDEADEGGEEDALLADLADKEKDKDNKPTPDGMPMGSADDMPEDDMGDMGDMGDMLGDSPDDSTEKDGEGDDMGLDDELGLGDEGDKGDEGDDSTEGGDEGDDSTEGGGDDEDPIKRVQELMGEIGVALDMMPSLSEPVLKNILNTMITKSARGLANASDETIDKFVKRIEKRGKKLDEQGYMQQGNVLKEYDMELDGMSDMERERDYDRNAGEEEGMDREDDEMDEDDVTFEQFVNMDANRYPEDDDQTLAQRIIDYLGNYGDSVSETCLIQSFDELEDDMTPAVKEMVLDAAQNHSSLKPFLRMLQNTSAPESDNLSEAYIKRLVKKLVTEEKRNYNKK